MVLSCIGVSPGGLTMAGVVQLNNRQDSEVLVADNKVGCKSVVAPSQGPVIPHGLGPDYLVELYLCQNDVLRQGLAEPGIDKLLRTSQSWSSYDRPGLVELIYLLLCSWYEAAKRCGHDNSDCEDRVEEVVHRRKIARNRLGQ